MNGSVDLLPLQIVEALNDTFAAVTVGRVEVACGVAVDPDGH